MELELSITDPPGVRLGTFRGRVSRLLCKDYLPGRLPIISADLGYSEGASGM